MGWWEADWKFQFAVAIYPTQDSKIQNFGFSSGTAHHACIIESLERKTFQSFENEHLKSWFDVGETDGRVCERCLGGRKLTWRYGTSPLILALCMHVHSRLSPNHHEDSCRTLLFTRNVTFLQEISNPSDLQHIRSSYSSMHVSSKCTNECKSGPKWTWVCGTFYLVMCHWGSGLSFSPQTFYINQMTSAIKGL